MSEWITTDEIAAFQRDGAVCVRGAFRDWVEVIAAGIERNLHEPGPYAGADENGVAQFVDWYCRWMEKGLEGDRQHRRRSVA